MAAQNNVTLRAGEAQPKDIRLYALPSASVSVSTTIYLRELHATPSTIVLYDPTAAPEAAGANTGTLAVTLDGVTLAATGVTTITGAAATTLDGVTLAASGAGTITGALAVTLEGVTLAATGELGEAPADDEPVDVAGSQRVFRAMERQENRRKRREREARERLRETLERAARAIHGEEDPPPEAAAAVAEAREILAQPAARADVAASLAEISAAIRQLEAVMREIEDDEEAAEMMLLAA